MKDIHHKSILRSTKLRLNMSITGLFLSDSVVFSVFSSRFSGSKFFQRFSVCLLMT